LTVPIVVPMKALAASKQRLAGVVSPERRAALSLWMMERVVQVACSISDVLVIGGDERVAQRALALGARWEADPWGDLNAVLQEALEVRPEGMLFIAGDLPLVTAADVRALIDGDCVMLARGRRDGTNAVFAPPGEPFRFSMGEGSYPRHAASLRGAWRPYVSPSLEADVDLPEDLAELERVLPELWKVIEPDHPGPRLPRPALRASSQ